MSEFEQLYREVILDHYKAPGTTGCSSLRTWSPRVRTRSAATR